MGDGLAGGVDADDAAHGCEGSGAPAPTIPSRSPAGPAMMRRNAESPFAVTRGRSSKHCDDHDTRPPCGRCPRRLLKYVAASVIGVVDRDSLLLFILAVSGSTRSRRTSSSVTISSVPRLHHQPLLGLGEEGLHSLKREIVPFWTMAFLGLLLSTFIVELRRRQTTRSRSSAWPTWAGSASSGWPKFFVLDKFIFGADPRRSRSTWSHRLCSRSAPVVVGPGGPPPRLRLRSLRLRLWRRLRRGRAPRLRSAPRVP